MKTRKMISIILALVLFVQSIPAWAETVVEIEPAENLPFITDSMPLESLNFDNAIVVADGNRTEDVLPDGASYENGVLTLDNACISGGIWARGDLKIVVKGNCSLTGSIGVEDGAVSLVGENNGRIEITQLDVVNGCLAMTDVELTVPDGVWKRDTNVINVSGNMDAKNSKILLPEYCGIFIDYGTMTFEDCVFDGMHLWVHNEAPVGGMHLTNCDITARSNGHTLFSYAGQMTLTDTVVHKGHVWAEEGVIAVNTTFEDCHTQWYTSGDIRLKNCKVFSSGTRGSTGMFAHNYDIYIEDSELDIREVSHAVVQPIRGVNVTIKNSKVNIESIGHAITPDQQLYMDSCDVTIKVTGNIAGIHRDASCIEIGTGGISEIINTKMNLKGNRAAISIIGGDLNIIASEIDAHAVSHGIVSDRGNVSVTGGKLNIISTESGIFMENGTLELSGVASNIKSTRNAVFVNAKAITGDVVTLNGLNANAKFVSTPNGIDTTCASADAYGNPVSSLILTPNGELFSVFRASQYECVMGSTASFVLSYFGANAGDVVITLPEGMTLTEGSVTVNGQIAPYLANGAAFTLPGLLPGQIVRFTAACEAAGEFEITAKAAGEALESARVTVKDFSLGLPSATARNTLEVAGISVPGSIISFYDDGIYIGRANANQAGDWIARLTIGKKVGKHEITAKIVLPNGNVINTEPETLTYDPETIEVLRLVMTNTIHGATVNDLETCETVFDFTTADVKKPTYAFFPEYPTFTFSAELSANATPEKVGRVFVRTENYRGEETYVYLTYNEFTGTWVGTHDYDEYSVPEVVQVGYTGGSGTIQVGDAYISYSLDADGGMTIGEDENTVRIVQSGNFINITDTDGNGLSLMLIDDHTMTMSTTDGMALATVFIKDDNVTIESADKQAKMTISEDGLSLSDIISGCSMFIGENSAEMSISDDGGNITRYLSDAISGDKIEYSDGTNEKWTHSEDGLNSVYTARDGSSIAYSYDEEGRLTKVDGYLTVEYGENEARYIDASGETLVSMDAEGNITAITYPGNLKVGYAYDENGNLTSVTDPMGNATIYVYDENGNIVSVSDGNGVVAEYVYDENGSLTGRILANGAHTEYAYDEAANTSSIRNLLPDGSVQSEHITFFDENGMAVSQSGSHGDWTFAYDENGQLLSMTPADGTATAYEYTAGGTIAAKTDANGRIEYASNALNQITQMGDTSFEYDLNGQLVREISPDGETAYEWDALGRLVKAILPGGDIYEYGYDAFGNRSTVTINGETTRYIWNPGELPEIIGAILPDGSYVRYIQGNGLEAQISEAGISYYQFDPLGSTVALTDADGQVVNSYIWNPVGESVSKQETVSTPFGYVGQYGIMTDGNGLQYMRARYMHEAMSAFISPDPAGQAYDENLYRYAGNNRVHYIDLTGEAPNNTSVFSHNKYGDIQSLLPNAMPITIPQKIEGIWRGNDIIDGSAKHHTNPFYDEIKRDPGPNDRFAKDAWKDAKGSLKKTVINALLDAGLDYCLKTFFPELENIWLVKLLLLTIDGIDLYKNILLLFQLFALFNMAVGFARIFIFLLALWVGWQIGSLLTDLINLIWPDTLPDIDPIEWILNPPFIDDTPVVIFPDDYFTTPNKTDPQRDPAGYVYEGATMARLEGVTATLYYKRTLETPDNQAVVWNAKDYSQVNPLITDAEGKYAWMTNTGWFKVVYEKEGYEKAESEWLPVPPIQTEVNIAMTSYAAPNVADVYVMGDRIGISFDKFMKLDNLVIELNGKRFDGEFFPIEQENGLVRTLALPRPDDQDTVTISVSGAVSYADVAMTPYSETVEVSNDVHSALTESAGIGYGSLESIRVRVLDSWNQPLANAELTIENLTEDTALLLTETAVSDEDGWFEIQLAGLKPAAAVLSVDGRANVQIQVRNENTSAGVYDEGLARDRQWRKDLHAEWTNGINESNALVDEYIAGFTAASEEIDAAVELEFVSELLAEWNREVSELIKKRQNGYFTTEEILRLDEIIAERALYASALIVP